MIVAPSKQPGGGFARISLLPAMVVDSRIMDERAAGGDVAIVLAANAVPGDAVLYALVAMPCT